MILASTTRCDDSRARAELGIEPRPLTETVADTVQWLHRAGHLTVSERD
jgi:nucleoside-diphosphate-sugar epimerase